MSRIQGAVTSLKVTCRDVAAVAKTLIATSGSISKLTNSALMGVFGGALGIGAGLVIQESLVSMPALFIPVLCIVGISGGVLTHRLVSGSISTEKEAVRPTAKGNHLLGELKKVRKLGAPSHVEDAIWEEYTRDVIRTRLHVDPLPADGRVSLDNKLDDPLRLEETPEPRE